MNRNWWIINIRNYGKFAFFGNVEEAEEMRRGKADWEGETGTKRKFNPKNEKDVELVDQEVRWSQEARWAQDPLVVKDERTREEIAAMNAWTLSHTEE